MLRWLYPIVILATLMLGGPTLALAQSDVEVNGSVELNFSTPGARSLGMGGSYLGSVDDATAAYSNPAGLLQLSKPEVLVEGRRWRYQTPFADRGRAAGTPTGIGADNVGGVSLGTAESELDGISYAAFVLPRPTWALAAYYHQVADFQSDFATGGIFSSGFRLRPVQSTYDLQISEAGLAFARQWHNGVAVGVGVSGYSFRLDSFTQRFETSTYYAPANFSRDAKNNFQTQSGEQRRVGGSLGLLWDRGGPLSLGMVYRFGPRFDMEVVSSTMSPGVPVPPRQEAHFAGFFDLPDVFGGGFTLRPNQRLTMSLDVNRVYYSQMIKDLVLVEGGGVSPEDFVLEDATEVHAGVEVLFTGLRMPIALRAGAWYDPDHRLRAETGPEFNQILFFAGEDQIHGTAGFGLSLRAVQIDAAADISERNKTASVSAAIRF
jgi:long-chain fatty acid transport protein